MAHFSLLIILSCLTSYSWGSDLQSFLEKTLKQNPGIDQKEYEMQSAKASVSALSSLEDPMIGWMKEGEINSWTLSQNFQFPLKYKVLRDVQKNKWQASQSALTLAQWEYREKIINTLFKLDTYTQNVKFIEAQKQNLSDALKLMTSKRANGGVKQQEEIRSYLEQTKIETQLILAKQMVFETKAELEALVGADALNDLPQKLLRPQISITQIHNDIVGPELKQVALNVESLSSEKTLSTLEYFPSFKLSTIQPFKSAEGAKTYAIEMSLPLWFLGKQNSMGRSANANFYAAKKEYELKSREQYSKAQGLLSKIQNMEKLLELYESSLLPQAQSSLQSNLSAYKVGGARFLDVVEAQILFYEEKMTYLDYGLKFVAATVELEKVLGKSISSFPEGKR